MDMCTHEEQPTPWNACLMCPRPTILNDTGSIATTAVPRHTTVTVAGARNSTHLFYRHTPMSFIHWCSLHYHCGAVAAVLPPPPWPS